MLHLQFRNKLRCTQSGDVIMTVPLYVITWSILNDVSVVRHFYCYQFTTLLNYDIVDVLFTKNKLKNYKKKKLWIFMRKPGVFNISAEKKL